MDAYNRTSQEPLKEASPFTQAALHQVVQPSSVAPSSPWSPGVWKRLPWTGFLALFTTVIATMLMIVILVHSNNQPAHWAVQPAVLLAVTSTIANILLRYALSEGVTVAWWVKSMKPGTHVSDLHTVWSFGTSIKEAALSGRAFNMVALAGILVAITPINTPLLQRASSVTSAIATRDISLTIPIAQEFPFGYTGIITGRAHATALTTSNFSAVVKNYANGVSVNVTDSGCNGRCLGTLQGAGYDIKCSTYLVSFNLSSALAILPDGSVNTTITNGTNVFSTNFTYSEEQLSTIGSGLLLNFSALYKSVSECDGYLNLTQCTLKPATLDYHVVLNNDTIALDPSYTYRDDSVIKYTPPEFQVSQGPTTHGGMGLALNSLFSSVGHLRFTGAVGYELVTSGAPSIEYSIAFFNSSDAHSLYACPVAWSNPTDDMLGTARQLAFRAALASANISNSTNIQTMNGFQETQLVVYNSHYVYLSVALVFTLLSTFATIPVFLGWWKLGRNVSLSPIEIAKAFDATALVSSDSNLPAKELLMEVGERQIRYGAVGLSAGSGYGVATAKVNASTKLVMGDPRFAQEPGDGNLFVG